MRMMRFAVLPAVIILLAGVACNGGASPTNTPTSPVASTVSTVQAELLLAAYLRSVFVTS